MEREQDGSLRIGGKIPDARPRRFSFLSCCKPEKENEQEEEEEVEAFETPFMPGGTAEIQAGSSTLPYLLSHIRRARTRAIARAALQACILSFNMDTDRQLSTTLFSTFILYLYSRNKAHVLKLHLTSYRKRRASLLCSRV